MIASKHIKYLGINPMKDVKMQVLYEDQKTLLREMNEDLNRAASYIYGMEDSVQLSFRESGILLCVRPSAYATNQQ